MPPKLDIITDNVTGNSYSRDLNDPKSTYAPYTAPTQPAEQNVEQPTMEQSGFASPYYQPQESVAGTYYQSQMNQPVDERKIRRDQINMFQDQINSLNQVYDQQLAKARQQGQGRIGSGTAILARRGLAGSPRGEALKEGVLEQNRGIEQGIQDERNIAVQAIYGKANELAQKEITERRAAKEAGATKYIEYLKGADERRASNLNTTISALLAQGIDPSQLDAKELSEIGKQIGVDGKTIIGQYRVAKSKYDAEQAAADFEREGVLLNRAKTQNDIDLANAKFAEDKRQFGLEYALKAQAATPAVSGTTQDTRSQLDFLLKTAQDIKPLSKYAGQGSVSKAAGDIMGDSKFRQLEAYANTLKTNMLTLATDPSIKKFFGPQMSNADVLLMTSAGTTLNPEKQNSAQLLEEVARLEDFFRRARAYLPSTDTATLDATTNIVTAPDGQPIQIVD